MRTYKIKYKVVFKGEVEVVADNKARGKMMVRTGFATPTLNVNKHHSWLSNNEEEEGIKNWDFNIHAEDVTLS